MLRSDLIKEAIEVTSRLMLGTSGFAIFVMSFIHLSLEPLQLPTRWNYAVGLLGIASLILMALSCLPARYLSRPGAKWCVGAVVLVHVAFFLVIASDSLIKAGGSIHAGDIARLHTRAAVFGIAAAVLSGAIAFLLFFHQRSKGEG
jgi:hypothetical protein